MLARICHNIPRHHGKYGTRIDIWDNSKTDEFGCWIFIEAFKTYKHQTEDGCDADAQEQELRERVEKKYPGIQYWGE